MKVKIFFIFSFAIFITLSLSHPSIVEGQVIKDIMGHSGSSFNKQQFKRALGQATTKVNHTAVLKLERGQLKGIDSSNEIETEARYGSWRIILNGWRIENGDDVIIKKGASVVMNYGHKMQYVFFSQEIPGYLYDRVDQKMEKRKKDSIKEYKDVTVEFGRNENQIMFVAEYPYTNANSGRIKDRLVYYMNESRWLINDSMEETRQAEKDYRKDMENKKFAEISLDEFLFLVGRLDEVTLKELQGGLGLWEFTIRDISFEYQLFGDKFVFSTYKPFPKGLSQETRDALIQKFTEQVTDKPAKGANSMEVMWYPGYEQLLWIKANYVLDGQAKGKDIEKWSDEFVDDYGKDLYKDLTEALKDYQENLADQPLTYLTSAGFMQLVNDGLDDFLKSREDIKEGLWEFHIDDNWFELHNYGDRVLLSIYRKLPDSVSKDKYPEILAKVKEKIDDKKAKGANAMEVQWYPGYPDVIWVKADYPFDGKLTRKDFNEFYKDFIYDYGKDRHKDIAKIVEKYD